MHKNEEFIEKYLSQYHNSQRKYAVLKIDHEKKIVDWFGDLMYFMDELPELFDDVYSYCNIIEGILPLDSEIETLPKMRMTPDVSADVHLIKDLGFYWISFVDVSEETESLRKTIQPHNDAILSRHRKKRKDCN